MKPSETQEHCAENMSSVPVKHELPRLSLLKNFYFFRRVGGALRTLGCIKCVRFLLILYRSVQISFSG